MARLSREEAQTVTDLFQARSAIRGLEVSLADPERLFGVGLQTAFNPNEIVQRRGMETIDEMRRDDQIKAALAFKKHAVIATGWTVTSPEGESEDWEVTQFIKNQIDNLDGSFSESLLQIMTALDYGYSITEKIFNDLVDGDFAGKIGLTALKTRKPHTFNFDTDEFGNLRPMGIIQDQPAKQVALPTEKFVVFSYQKEFGNFYGLPDLDAAHRAWWTKKNAYRWLSMLLERYGIPPLFALYNRSSLQGGEVENLKKIVSNLMSATGGVIPREDKDDLEMWAPELSGSASKVFLPALQMFNSDIARALLMPGLLGMTPDSSTGSFARAKVQFDVFELILMELRRVIEERVVQEQIINPLVRMNYATEHFPVYKFMPLTDEVRLDLFETWGTLTGQGIVISTRDDEKFIRQSLDFPERDEGGKPLVEPKEPEPKAAAPDDEDDDDGEGEGEGEEKLSIPYKPYGDRLRVTHKTRLSILARDPVCKICGEAPSTELDHRKPVRRGGEDGRSNLQGVCGPCHVTKTGREKKRAARLRAKEQKLAESQTDHQASRAPNKFEGRVDFAEIEKTLEGIGSAAVESTAVEYAKVRDKLVADVERNFRNDLSFLRRLDMPSMAGVEKAIFAWTTDAYDEGVKSITREIGEELSEFAATPSFPTVKPRDAIAQMKTKAFWITGVTGGDLEMAARGVLITSIETGALLAVTTASLRNVFEPYVGDPNVVRDGAVLTPHRLETIVRTNTTDSFNRGRLVQGRSFGEGLVGWEYSAILDGRVTEVCRHLDGRVFRDDDPDVNTLKPPRHFNCRSILVPITIASPPVDERDFITPTQAAKGLELSGAGFSKPFNPGKSNKP